MQKLPLEQTITDQATFRRQQQPALAEQTEFGVPAPASKLEMPDGAPLIAELLEAKWRAEELTAVYEKAQMEAASTRAMLERAEQAIVGLNQIIDAAQVAIDQLKATTERELLWRGVLAAELYRITTIHGATKANRSGWWRRLPRFVFATRKADRPTAE